MHTFSNAPNLFGLWGNGPNDVWAGGEGVLIHWTGDFSNPIVMPINNVGVFGLCGSANDLWAVGSQGAAGAMVMHWDGATWSQPMPIAGASILFGVWGSGPDDIWAVGMSNAAQTGVVARKIGASWSSAMPIAGTSAASSVWGVAR